MPAPRLLGVRSDWIECIEMELSVLVALPESVLGDLAITPRRCRATLPVCSENDKVSGGTCEKKPDQVEDAGQKLGCKLKEPGWSGVAASLAEKLVGKEWPLIVGVVAEWTTKMVDAASKFVEVALEKGR